MNDTLVTGEWETRQLCVKGVVVTPERSKRVKKFTDGNFSWGFDGGESRQLALAILLEVMPPGSGPEARAVRLAPDFTKEILAKKPAEKDFIIALYTIAVWLSEKPR